jgi:hypothetical protein
MSIGISSIDANDGKKKIKIFCAVVCTRRATVLPLVLMKKLPTERKAQRLSTSIPAELEEWIEDERDRVANQSAYGHRPSVAAVVTRALYEYKSKVQERDEQDVKKMGEQMSEAAKKVNKKKQ